MPCLLQPDLSMVDESTTITSLSPAPLHLVPCSASCVPLGLFPALVVKISHTWRLASDERFRNRICFIVEQGGENWKVEFRHYADHMELHLIHTRKSINSSILLSCRKQLWEALNEVSARYSHMKNVEWRFGFSCPGGLQQGCPHPAICSANTGSPDTPENVVCFDTPPCGADAFPLKEIHKCWFQVRSHHCPSMEQQ